MPKIEQAAIAARRILVEQVAALWDSASRQLDPEKRDADLDSAKKIEIENQLTEREIDDALKLARELMKNIKTPEEDAM